MDSTKSKVAKRKVSQIGEDSSVKAKKFTKNTRSKEPISKCIHGCTATEGMYINCYSHFNISFLDIFFYLFVNRPRLENVWW